MVDASGRSSQLPQWLDAIGVTPPSAQCISAGLGYGSRTYAMPENWFQEKVSARPGPVPTRLHDCVRADDWRDTLNTIMLPRLA